MKAWLTAVLLVLAGCAVERDPSRVYTVTGQDLGPRSGKQITVAESKVSFMGEKDPVRSREVRSLKDRYTEFLVLQNGTYLTYGKLYLSGFTARDSDEDLLRGDLEAPGYRNRGIVFDRAAVKRFGPFAYFVQESKSDTCFAFRGDFGDTTNGRINNRGDQEAYGGVCYSSSVRTAASLEAEMIALLGRVRFDDGAINKARAANSVTPPVAVTQPVPPSAAVTSPPSPASQAGANMATRLRELRGLFDQGLINQSEYDQRRQAMLNSL
jgi:hypothetical protein